MWSGNPRITVTFIYGNTSGALAPDNDKAAPIVGSAWKIAAQIQASQGGAWNVTNPSNTGSQPHPSWVLEPTNTNKSILGTGAQANITFSFDSIVSFTPPGHTQMIVQFSGFAKDESTLYDDQVFVIDIVKLSAPLTRGLLNFFAENPVVTLNKPGDVEIPLRWAMLDVDSINLITNHPGIEVQNVSYPNPLPLAYDNRSITVPRVVQSSAIFCTLQAFNGLGSYLNSTQFTVFIEANMFVDPRDGQVYPAVLLDGRLWMAKSLNHTDRQGSYFYNDDKKNGDTYGQLYTADSDSVSNPPDKNWRIPSQADWESLIATYPSPEEAYTALTPGGDSGFEALLSGYRDNSGTFQELLSYGYYRSSTGDKYASFSGRTKSVNAVAQFPGDYALAIRYVQDL